MLDKTNISAADSAHHAGPKMFWTPERNEQLKRLWSEGHTASKVAELMSVVSRSAICGAVHRLGLPKRGRTPGSGRKASTDPALLDARLQENRRKHRERMRLRQAARRGLSAADLSAGDAETPAPRYEGSLNLPFAELRCRRDKAQNQCRFIEGDAPEFRSCGNETPQGSSWCVHHQHVVFEKPEHRRRVNPESNRRGAKISTLMGSYEL